MLIGIWFVIGLFFGSFINALVWRVHEQAKKKPRKDLSILHGRSMCTHCGHQLAWYDLVPVFSWLTLGGKCRYCRKTIHWQYPVVELVTATLFAVSYAVLPESSSTWLTLFNFVSWLVILIGFVALVVYDFRWMLLPNRILYPLIVVAVIAVAVNAVAASEWSIVFDALYSVAVAGGIFYLLYIISNGTWIGGGDVKLGVLIGLVLPGPFEAFLMLLLASTLGTVLIVPGLLLKKVTTKSRIPFGPFLITAAVFVVLWGDTVISWYKQTLLGL